MDLCRNTLRTLGAALIIGLGFISGASAQSGNPIRIGMSLALTGAGAAPSKVSIVHFLFHRSCWSVGNYCYLQDLFVAKEARGRGVGRALIEAVESDARAAGASRVYWLTKEDNFAARALYNTLADRSGFIQYRKVF
jgi:GNAT superfamily N-acetyltransferase